MMAQSQVYPTPYGAEGKVSDDVEEDDGIDLNPDLKCGWWNYTYNVNKNKYFICIQWKMKGKGDHAWRKHGARRCTINGKSAKITHMINSKSAQSKKYSNKEFVKIKQKDKEYRLYYLSQCGWCWDDGDGVVVQIKKTNHGMAQAD